MRFTAFLKITILSNAISFGLLAAIAVNRLITNDQLALLAAGITWLVIASLSGMLLGRKNELLESISKLLFHAKVVQKAPDTTNLVVIANRLWLLITVDIVSLMSAFFIPQLTIIASGFALFLALIWRKQVSAIINIESQELVSFYVNPGSPFSAINLVKVPGQYPGDSSLPDLKLVPSSSRID